MMIACKLMLGSHRMMTSEAQFPNPPAISSNSPPTLRIPDRVRAVSHLASNPSFHNYNLWLV